MLKLQLEKILAPLYTVCIGYRKVQTYITALVGQIIIHITHHLKPVNFMTYKHGGV